MMVTYGSHPWFGATVALQLAARPAVGVIGAAAPQVLAVMINRVHALGCSSSWRHLCNKMIHQKIKPSPQNWTAKPSRNGLPSQLGRLSVKTI
jgi:hypothetical protein